jgi:hypothetical protein
MRSRRCLTATIVHATERWASIRQRTASPQRPPAGARATVGWRAADPLKSIPPGSDQKAMSSPDRLPVKAGPVPDKLTIWPVDDGRYGLDATFQGASGYQRAEHHQQELQRRGVLHTFRQELGGGWTLRFGPFRAIDVAAALSAFVY